ncbi:MAG: DUF1501 domain-containing protein, partial [Gemmataceae bacterium]
MFNQGMTVPDGDDALLDRRTWFSWVRSGLGGAALTTLLARDGLVRADRVRGEASDPPPHHPAKAKRVLHIVLCGGMSHIDTFDYKPSLEKFHGKQLLSSERPETFFGQVGLLRQSDWKFRRHGKSGLWMSELFPHMAGVIDELTFVYSMAADSANHTPATFQEITGFRFNGYPSMGAWLSYGMGSETEELPAYVVLPDARGLPAGSTINWSSGFLPARHQGVAFRTQGAVIEDLVPAQKIDDKTERDSREILAALNQRHLERVGENDRLAARIKSYELAARMQLAVPRVTDLSRETAQTRRHYGLEGKDTEAFGRSCLLARRLLEQGVRFVQVFSGGSFGSPRINWDGHEDMRENHGNEARRIDQPVAALIRDLRQRGMLDDTLVLFTKDRCAMRQNCEKKKAASKRQVIKPQHALRA